MSLRPNSSQTKGLPFLAAVLGSFTVAASICSGAAPTQEATESIWPTKEWQTSTEKPTEVGATPEMAAIIRDFLALSHPDSPAKKPQDEQVWILRRLQNTVDLRLYLLNDQSYYRLRRCVPMPQERSRKASEVALASLILTLLSRRPRRFSGITAIIRLRLMTFARQPAFCEEVCIAHLVTREGY